MSAMVQIDLEEFDKYRDKFLNQKQEIFILSNELNELKDKMGNLYQIKLDTDMVMMGKRAIICVDYKKFLDLFKINEVPEITNVEIIFTNK